MILVIVIDQRKKTDMKDPIIPKVIVIDDGIMLWKYFTEEHQAVILCGFPLLFKLPGKAG
jgi:hypothetical protein